MIKIVISFTFICLIISCDNVNESDINEILEVEKSFSDMSKEKGMVEAFNYYCHEKGVILRQQSYPIIGNEAIAVSISDVQDSLFTLTWKASDAMIAKSGELGYSYGIFTMAYHNDSIESSYGTYVTIWVKNEDGNWRYILDTGQNGLE